MNQHVIWNVHAPITEASLSEKPSPTVIQLWGNATRCDHELLDQFLGSHPETTLALIEANEASNLEFLCYYPRVHRLRIALDGVTSFDGLKYLRSDLAALTLGSTRRKGLSLTPLRRFSQLRELGLVEQKRDIDVVGDLKRLEGLFLSRITLPGLDPFLPLTNLRRLKIMLGGTHNLRLLPEFASLQRLSIFRVNGLRELSVLSELRSLVSLTLEQLKHLEELPSLAKCVALRFVRFDGLGLREVRNVADAPSLEELTLFSMPNLHADALAAFVGHPSLRAATIRTGKERVDVQATALLNLREVGVNSDLQ
jgi:hypothetical protein